MSELNIDGLKAAASSATPGPWRVFDQVHCQHQVVAGSDTSPMVLMDGNQYFGQQAKFDVAFVAAANPAAILALIERLRVAEDIAKRATMGDQMPALIVELVDNGYSGKPHIRKWDNPGGLTAGTYHLFTIPPSIDAKDAERYRAIRKMNLSDDPWRPRIGIPLADGGRHWRYVQSEAEHDTAVDERIVAIAAKELK